MQSVSGANIATIAASIPGSVTQGYATQSIVLAGIHDLTKTAAEVEGLLEDLLALTADPRCCTILPFGGGSSWTSAKEAVRQEVNTWILANTQGIDAEDVIGDGDPDQPRIKAEYDAGDGVHLNNAGKLALAQAMYDQGFA